MFQGCGKGFKRAGHLNPQVDSPPFTATVAAASPSMVLPGRPGPLTVGFKRTSADTYYG